MEPICCKSYFLKLLWLPGSESIPKKEIANYCHCIYWRPAFKTVSKTAGMNEWMNEWMKSLFIVRIKTQNLQKWEIIT